MIPRPTSLSAKPKQLAVQQTINPKRYGISFSLKQCQNFGLNPRATLDWLIAQGWRRFRLMNYWDWHEPSPGAYTFDELDWQINIITAAGGEISLCLGVKQPRWPEYHWPGWAWELPMAERNVALLRYVEQTVNRYKDAPAIISWQLENEALLNGFGERIDIDRQRLHREYALIKRLDTQNRPLIMSTSNGWGIPIRGPVPDLVGFSYYPLMYQKGRYQRTIQKPWLHRLRTRLILVLLSKQVFIHELQCEPWGPEAIWKMTTTEQDQSMSAQQIAHNLHLAHTIKLYPIDLWGAEWWYWRWLQGDSKPWYAVRDKLQT